MTFLENDLILQKMTSKTTKFTCWRYIFKIILEICMYNKINKNPDILWGLAV